MAMRMMKDHWLKYLLCSFITMLKEHSTENIQHTLHDNCANICTILMNMPTCYWKKILHFYHVTPETASSRECLQKRLLWQYLIRSVQNNQLISALLNLRQTKFESKNANSEGDKFLWFFTHKAPVQALHPPCEQKTQWNKQCELLFPQTHFKENVWRASFGQTKTFMYYLLSPGIFSPLQSLK